MTGAWLGLLQDVHLEDALEAGPDGEEERVEGDVPGPGGEISVEGILDEWFLIPLHLLILETVMTARVRCSQSSC